MVYTDGNYDNPTITKVITFGSEYEDDNLFAKELILDDERTQSSLDYAFEIIKEIYGEGYVIERNMAEHSAIGRQTRRGKGTNSRTTSSTDEIRFDIEDRYSSLKKMHGVIPKGKNPRGVFVNNDTGWNILMLWLIANYVLQKWQ